MVIEFYVNVIENKRCIINDLIELIIYMNLDESRKHMYDMV